MSTTPTMWDAGDTVRPSPPRTPQRVHRRRRSAPGHVAASFARVGKGGVPGFGVLARAVLGTILIAPNYTAGPDTTFRGLVLITTFTGCVPYLLSDAAQLYWLAKGTRGRVRPAGLTRDLIVAAFSFAFSFWLIAGAGYAAVYQACCSCSPAFRST